MIRNLGLGSILVASLAVPAPVFGQQMPGRIGVHLEQIDRASGAVPGRASFTCRQPVPLVARAEFGMGYAFLTLRQATAAPAYRIEASGAERLPIPTASRRMASRLMTLQLFPTGADSAAIVPPLWRQSELPSLRLRITVLHLPD